MNMNFVPSPQDSALLMENAITKTATFNGTTFDNGTNFAPGGCGQPIGIVIQITALDVTSTDETYTFTVQESDDNSSWTTITTSLAAGTGGGVGVGVYTIPAFVSKRYTRLVCTIAGTTPTITYTAWGNPYIAATG